MQDWEDNRLAEAFRQQPDARIFEVLVARHHRYAFAIAISQVKSETDAADVVQESFLRMARSLHTFKQGSKFSTWLYSVVYFTSVDWLRRHNKTGYSQIEDIGQADQMRLSVDSLADGIDKKIRAEYIQKALKLLSKDDTLILTLFYFMDQSLDEIGLVMNIPGRSAIKTRLFRARAEMKRRLNLLLGGNAKEEL